MATKKEQEVIEIKALDIQYAPIRIVGDSPLIVHAWSEKAKRMMLEAQTGEKKGKKKELRNPVDDFAQSMYWLEGAPDETWKAPDGLEMPEVIEFANNKIVEAHKTGAKWGFPVGAIKQSGNAAAYRMNWVRNQMGLRGAYFFQSEYGQYAEIKGDLPVMREDMVRIGMGSADLRYRAEFRNWFIDMVLEYNASGEYKLENIINIISAGGYVTGLGEWRPEKDGEYGRFHIELTK